MPHLYSWQTFSGSLGASHGEQTASGAARLLGSARFSAPFEHAGEETGDLLVPAGYPAPEVLVPAGYPAPKVLAPAGYPAPEVLGPLSDAGSAG